MRGSTRLLSTLELHTLRSLGVNTEPVLRLVSELNARWRNRFQIFPLYVLYLKHMI